MSATIIAVPSETDVVKWNENDVQQFLTANQTAFNLKDGDISTMKKQDIDGLALLALNRDILLTHFGFTYGSASRMESLIEHLKSTQAPDPEALGWSNIIPSTEIYGYTQPKGFPSILPMKLGCFWNCSDVVSGLREYFQVGTAVLTPATRTAVIQNRDMTRLTQAWLEFLKNSNDHFSYVFWIDATSKATLNSTFRAIVDPEDIEKLHIDNNATLVKAILQKIGGLAQNWLLVFENASDAALVKSHSPYVKKGSIIVTTKDPTMHPLVSDTGGYFKLKHQSSFASKINYGSRVGLAVFSDQAFQNKPYTRRDPTEPFEVCYEDCRLKAAASEGSG